MKCIIILHRQEKGFYYVKLWIAIRDPDHVFERRMNEKMGDERKEKAKQIKNGAKRGWKPILKGEINMGLRLEASGESKVMIG